MQIELIIAIALSVLCAIVMSWATAYWDNQILKRDAAIEELKLEIKVLKEVLHALQR